MRGAALGVRGRRERVATEGTHQGADDGGPLPQRVDPRRDESRSVARARSGSVERTRGQGRLGKKAPGVPGDARGVPAPAQSHAPGPRRGSRSAHQAVARSDVDDGNCRRRPRSTRRQNPQQKVLPRRNEVGHLPRQHRHRPHESRRPLGLGDLYHVRRNRLRPLFAPRRKVPLQRRHQHPLRPPPLPPRRLPRRQRRRR
mmetsp:Transcript_11204/g.37011  ORF Transcript_11204/g.37011 Transcript_11204/m.37011 type:complete len:200 (+) Transcript_11204:548-1147(+)